MVIHCPVGYQMNYTMLLSLLFLALFCNILAYMRATQKAKCPTNLNKNHGLKMNSAITAPSMPTETEMPQIRPIANRKDRCW